MSDVILKLDAGLRILSGHTTYDIPQIALERGKWISLIPVNADLAADPSGILSRTVASLKAPVKGSVSIFDVDVYNAGYQDVQRLRSKIGFVQGYGGLLSNKTVRENLELPVSVHGGLSQSGQNKIVNEQLEKFELVSVKKEKPHFLDGFTKWRICLARALILKPKFVVLEGIGDWNVDGGNGLAWKQIEEYHNMGDNAICICPARRNKAFEKWFKEKGGTVIGFADTHTTMEYLK
ncbi:MAG: ATP-binding cassette domain-containing protein [Deltaproteobacteria bacterium]|nr:ATP-binding cassette domain-containing protein [Deltaproteobacteria bacterium]